VEQQIVSVAFLCPGQASQKVGMGYDLYNNTKLGKKYFDIANDVMNVDIKNIIFNGPEEKLKQTNYTQPAIYIVSVIIGELLINKGINPVCAAGHSLGEYSALTLAKSFDFVTGLELVKIRSEAMQNACKLNKGTMAAVIGLEDDKIIEICQSHENIGIVVAANFNAKAQVVISGELKAIKSIIPLMKEAGALKVLELNVSGAFHSPLMSSAKKILSDKLSSININNSSFPIYSNTTALPISNSNEIKNALIEQLDSPVLWHQSITKMIKDGVKNAIEVGPGRVLQGLTKRIDRSLNMNGVESLEKIVNFKYV
jgi:[acyl-carrier-protein] S-malonyltransferase